MAQPFLLGSLPLEALGECVSFLSGREIGRLWQCGSLVLNNKLGGAVKKFELQLDFLFPVQWPSILSNLSRVSDLRIFDDKYSNDQLELAQFPFVAPPALRTLTLEFRNASTSLLRALERSPTMLPTLEVLRINGEQDNLTKKDADILKSLSSLTILDFRYASYDEGQLSDFLPPNLVELRLDLYRCHHVDFNLPQSLTSFELKDLRYTVISVEAAFPPGLTKFCFASDSKFFEAEEILLLPRSLTHLNVLIDLASPEIWSALPPALRTLKSSYDGGTPTNDHMKLYPPTVTNTNWHPAITVENVELLPPGLTKLTKVSNNPRVFSKLPKTLRSIDCTYFGLIDGPSASTVLISLPPTLTKLTTFNTHNLTLCESLPSTLTHLRLIEGTFTPQHARLLPAGLKYLIIYAFEPECLAGLPPGLTSLSAGDTLAAIVVTAQQASVLPRTLTYLSLNVSHFASTEAIYALPQGLLMLFLTLRTFDKSCDLLKAPPSLRQLAITIAKDEDGLADSILSTLPRKLVSCNLTIGGRHSSSNIREESLQNLPIGLGTLMIPGSDALQNSKYPPDFLPMHLPHVSCGWEAIWHR